MTGLIGHAKAAGSLQRNSLWLMSTTVINSALGYGYWLLVARAYSPADVGLATGLIALMIVTSLASNLGTASALVARLPQRTSDEEWSTTLSATLLGGAALGALAALGVLAALPLISHSLAVARHDPALAALFATGASLWTAATVLDYTFIAQRQSRGMAARGLVFGAAKIPLLLAAPVAVGAHAGVSVVLASWVAACALSCALMLAFAIPRVRPGARLRVAGTAGELRAMTRLLAGNHLITLGNALPAYLLPVIVVSRLSTRENAFFYITWLVGGIFFMVSSSVGSSLYAEGSHTPERLRHQLAASVRLTASLLLLAMSLMVVAGHPVLGAFGPEYARRGFVLLLILTAAAIPDAITNIYVAVLRVEHRLATAAALTCGMAAIAVAGSWLVAPSEGLEGIGIVWLGSQSMGSLWVVSDLARSASQRRRERPAASGASRPMADALPRAPIALVSVELTEPLPRLERKPAADGSLYETARVLVQLHTVPLGLVDVPLHRNDTTAEELAHRIETELGGEITEHLRADGLPHPRLRSAGLPPTAEPPCLRFRRETLRAAPAVTVVIPTRARPDLLMRCVASVLDSEYPAERIAVIVADNRPPNAETRDRLREEYAEEPRVSYIRCDVPGSAAARNAGIEHAKTEYVAMVDDDVIVDRHWLAELLGGLVHDQRTACVTGAVLPVELETEAQTLLERYGGFHKGFAPARWSLSKPPAGDRLFPYTAGRFGSGGNVAYRRSAIRALGGYDAALSVAGEDLDVFIRVLTGGWALRYQPTALAWHLHRRDGAGLEALIHRYGIGIGALLLRTVAREPRALVQLARRAIPGLLYVLRPSSAKNAGQGYGYPVRLRGIELAGMARGPFVYLQARRAARSR